MSKNTIDKNVKPLVDCLNSIENIHTIGSCGGHENHLGGQQPEGKFFVTFSYFSKNREFILKIKTICEKNNLIYKEHDPIPFGVWYSICGDCTMIDSLIKSLY